MMRAWVCVGLLFAVGCRREPKVVDQPVAPLQPSSPLDPAKKSEQSALMAPVMQQMEREKLNRPTGTLTTDQVFAAIEGAGIKLNAKTQVLGAPMKARYCAVAISPAGLGLSVCEFDQADGPATGRDIAKKKFPTLERDFYINKNTLITVNDTAKTPAVKVERDKVAALVPTLTVPK